jgi:hypothetical protein
MHAPEHADGSRLVTLTSFLEAVCSFSEYVLPGERGRSPAEEARLFFMDAGRWSGSSSASSDSTTITCTISTRVSDLRDLHHWLNDNDPS